MKLPIGLAAAALLATGFVTATPEPASAVIYCTYVGYPAGCVARAGVVLRPRPVARAAVTPGTPMNRGGPVNRNSYRVLLDPNGEIVWETVRDGKKMRYRGEPETGFRRRFVAGLWKFLPIDSQL